MELGLELGLVSFPAGFTPGYPACIPGRIPGSLLVEVVGSCSRVMSTAMLLKPMANPSGFARRFSPLPEGCNQARTATFTPVVSGCLDLRPGFGYFAIRALVVTKSIKR